MTEPKSSDEVWAEVNAEVQAMARHVGGPDPLDGLTPAQRAVVRIYAVNAYRLGMQAMAEALVPERVTQSG